MAIAHPLIFSIVIPSYNYAHYLPRAIKSVTAQEGNDYEIVVVDDGSTDDTAAVVKNMQMSAQAPIRYVYQTNSGLSATRNRGAREAGGRFLLFLDADDALCPGALAHVRGPLQRQPHIDFVVGGYVISRISGTTKLKKALALTADRQDNFFRYLRGDLNSLPSGSVVAARKVFDRLQFPCSDMMWEDIVFYAHMLALYDGLSIPEPLVTIYRHATSLGHNVDRVRRDYHKPLDRLFNPAILPNRLMPMRDEFASITSLHLFTFFYKRGFYEEAREAFRRAVRVFPRHLFKWRHLRRYLTIVVKTIGRRSAH
jgi:glycosyltransferase involved in cell wall biosynthesis